MTGAALADGRSVTDEQRLAHIAAGLPDAVVVIDPSATLLWANDAAARLFGGSAHELVGLSAIDFVHPDDKETAAAALASVQGKTVGTPIEIRVRAVDGWRLVEIVGANLLQKQPVEGLVLCLRDLTERRRWEVASDDVGRFRSLVHNAASIIMLLDATGRIESVSAAITRILGHDQELVEGRPLVELVTRRDRNSLAAAIARAVDQPEWSKAPTTVEVELLRRAGTESVPFELSIVNLVDDPTVRGLVVSGHDISQLRATRDALQEMASHDPLTELPNRTALRAHLEHRLESPKTAVVFLDLDGFKPINDRFGHGTGDDILRTLAQRLRSSVRPGDVVARYGDDEFVVVAEIDDAEQLRKLAGRLAEGVEQPVVLPEGTFQLQASVGLAHPWPDDTPTTLLARADAAMYIAKRHGNGLHSAASG